MSLPDLSSLSLQELNELLEDEEKLNKMAEGMEEVRNIQPNKDMSLASNRSLAEQNLEYHPKLDSLKIQLTRKYQELQTLFEAYQMRKSKLESQSSGTSLDVLLALLQTEGAKIEEETEIMAQEFLDGEVPLDIFIEQYQNKRKLAHQRRVKIEKMQEIVLKGPGLNQARLPQLPNEPVQTNQNSNSMESNTPPVMPRRVPPPPPVQTGAFPTPFTSAALGAESVPPYPVSAAFPPIPPRSGFSAPISTSQLGYPLQYRPPCPPPVAQKAGQRPPQPGFILQ
ncbi:VPS37B subunit of ESCRT-I a [Chiloscyllium plagiosum]|uniref:VPS37B subunit of ESCRT-I a n=1 Tax=Chiloscyllium plagiosum TaxID=36176 RepID=UPI001CB7E23C|nr:VPS37B subunit of ESCRT-I a [Chiloscyllium plagiosum]